MTFCDVALLASKVIAVGIHVNINRTGWILHGRVEIAVLDRITATTIEVTGAAVETARCTNALGDVNQVDTLGRVSCSRGFFNVGSRSVMADQAVNLAGISEVEAGICPAVAGVTAGAAWLIAGD